MIQDAREALDRGAGTLLGMPPERLVLAMTALLLVLYSAPFNLPEKLLLPIVCGAMLVFPRLLLKPAPWLLVLATMAVTMALFWCILDNHQYLITYWCIVCVLAVQAEKPAEVLRWNARLLVGLCFFFATFTKLVRGNFLDGSFLGFQLLIDQRLEHGAMLFGGLQAEELQRNRELVGTLLTSPPGLEVTLVTSARLQWATLVGSIGILLIEGTLALAFLSPRPGWLHRRRDLVFLAFFVTTYPFAPVPGFAAILAVLGLAQCPPDRPKTRLAYVAFFLMIPLIVRLPSELPRLTSFLLGQP